MKAHRASPVHDPGRLAALRATGLLDASPRPELDRLSRLGAATMRAPIAALALVDSDREFFVSGVGLPEAWGRDREVPLSHSYCVRVVSTGRPLVVEDARADRRLRKHGALRDQGIVAYAGMPLRGRRGEVVGTFCAMDTRPHRWDGNDVAALEDLAAVAQRELDRDVGGDGSPSSGVFHTLVERSLAGIAILRDSRFRYVNPTFAAMLGYTREELIASGSVLDLVADADRRLVEQHLRRRFSGERKGVQFMFRGRRKDGATIHLEVYGAHCLIDGEPAIVSTAIDRTDHVRALQALRESEEALRLVLQATNDVVWDWDLAAGTVRWSDNAPRMLRYAPGEVAPTIEWWYERIPPEDRERVVGGLHEVAGGAGETWAAEHRFQRGDGSVATVLDRGLFVRDERGVPTRMVASMLDTTERRRSEEAQRLMTQVGTVMDGSFDYRTTLPTVARLVVPTLADYCTIDLLEDGGLRRVAAAHADPVKEPLLEAGALRPLSALDDAEAAAIRKQRSVLVSEGVGAPVEPGPRPGSKVVVPLIALPGLLGVLTLAADESRRLYGPMELLTAEDVARRVTIGLQNGRLYEEAQQAIRDRDQILAVVTHDLRNPLGTIGMLVELIRAEEQERRSGKLKWLDMIQRSLDGMGRLVDDLVDLSSIDSGGFRVAPAPRAVSSLLEEACALLQPVVAQKSMEVACETEGEDVSVAVDDKQILRVFSNLVGNAIKFTPEHGRIVLRAHRKDAEVCFSVADTGPGIPADQISRVFDRYWQARKGDRRGAGLGLSIAKGIVEAHGGRIWVESRPGDGTTVYFTTPLAGGG